VRQQRQLENGQQIVKLRKSSIPFPLSAGARRLLAASLCEPLAVSPRPRLGDAAQLEPKATETRSNTRTISGPLQQSTSQDDGKPNLSKNNREHENNQKIALALLPMRPIYSPSPPAPPPSKPTATGGIVKFYYEQRRARRVILQTFKLKTAPGRHRSGHTQATLMGHDCKEILVRQGRS